MKIPTRLQSLVDVPPQGPVDVRGMLLEIDDARTARPLRMGGA